MANGIRKILDTAMASNCNPRFTELKDVQNYLKFLSLIGVPVELAMARIHPPKGSTNEDLKKMEDFWSQNLKIPKNHINQSNRNPGRNPFGSVEILVGECSENGRIKGIYAFRFAIYLMVIAFPQDLGLERFISSDEKSFCGLA